MGRRLNGWHRRHVHGQEAVDTSMRKRPQSRWHVPQQGPGMRRRFVPSPDRRQQLGHAADNGPQIQHYEIPRQAIARGHQPGVISRKALGVIQLNTDARRGIREVLWPLDFSILWTRVANAETDICSIETELRHASRRGRHTGTNTIPPIFGSSCRHSGVRRSLKRIPGHREERIPLEENLEEPFKSEHVRLYKAQVNARIANSIWDEVDPPSSIHDANISAGNTIRMHAMRRR